MWLEHCEPQVINDRHHHHHDHYINISRPNVPLQPGSLRGNAAVLLPCFKHIREWIWSIPLRFHGPRSKESLVWVRNGSSYPTFQEWSLRTAHSFKIPLSDVYGTRHHWKPITKYSRILLLLACLHNTSYCLVPSFLDKDFLKILLCIVLM